MGFLLLFSMSVINYCLKRLLIATGMFSFMLSTIGLVAIALAATNHAHAEVIDIVRFHQPHPKEDLRYLYTTELIELSLKKTQPLYGDYRIQQSHNPMARDRVLRQLIKGQTINAFVAATNSEWESKTIPIRIPIFKGLLSYRLLLINAKDQYKFNKIIDAEQLKQLQAGLKPQWTTTLLMQANNFPIVKGNTYKGLFAMLSRGRFDYFPRGINEIFVEFDKNHDQFPNIVIEANLVIYLPSPSYLFISQTHPRLADRISTGLEMMVIDGSFDEIFYRYHSENIKKAKLENRRVINIENTWLPPLTPLSNKSLWYQPDFK
ncbi:MULTISPECIES: amino acid ABC transporter substrate-binding protein [Shewanella]|uniref:amino acid ABC transporter substrate-binding protein n=1 Tax=Shewanella TaxID=22 RepID=UPI000F50745E|nr:MULTISPECIES: amino acid ABC transporter substrate-binding protein [Shewanella]